MKTINVRISFLNELKKVQVNNTHTVEYVITEICKLLKIGPVAKPLFGLHQPQVQAWLSLSYLIYEDDTKEYEFAMRFRVPEIERLRHIDENAYDFYFKQARHRILHKKLQKTQYEAHRSEIMGLSVLDMYRATIEDGVSRVDVVHNYQRYVPTMAKKKYKRFFMRFLKVPIVNKFLEIKLENADAAFFKSGYLEQFHRIIPDYLIEEFRGVVNTNTVSVYEVLLRVNPFDAEFPGISIKYENKNKWEHLCTIDELCYLTEKSDGTVALNRKNGVPLFVKFHRTAVMTSFITAIDGYYRLMVKWTFNLSRHYPTPSLKELQKLKCHGPISAEFARRKLAEKRNNKPGCYILRECDLSYDNYHIDICTEIRHSPVVTYKIIKTSSNTYKLDDSVNEYSSITQLLKEEKWQERNITLKECLPPSDFDQSNLLLCQLENNMYMENKSRRRNEDDVPTLTKPACIDRKSLQVFKNEPLSGRSPSTIVYRGVWQENAKSKRNIAMKKLSDTLQEHVTKFLELTNQWAFVSGGSVVKVYGFTLSTPVSMVMEYLPYGPLDAYLADVKNRNQLKEATLVEASVALANALYYMEEAGFVHGYIRCRKLLVAEHTDTKFIVKLADPRLFTVYDDIDLHWIPPEHHNNPAEARTSVAADVWAFATTLWEIFSYGKQPTPTGDANTIKQMYEDPNKRLIRPSTCPQDLYYLMMECWHHDADARKKPQAILRDINQIFYQVYNCRRDNPYAIISPRISSNDPDNISHKSKISDEFSASVQSGSTVNTTVDDGFGLNSATSLSFGNKIVVPDIVYRPAQVFPKGPSPNPTDSKPSDNSLQDFSSQETSISSLHSIYKLDREWYVVPQGFIGQGFYGTVYAGLLMHMYDNDKQNKVAVKKLKPDLTNLNAMSDFKNEIEIMKKLNKKIMKFSK